MGIKAENIVRTYGRGSTALTVLNGLNFSCDKGELVGIYGASGTGKSTLLHVIGGLDRPDGGKVFWQGEDLYGLSEQGRARYRNRNIGFVFQFYHLLPEFTAWENVMLPCLIAGRSQKDARERAHQALAQTGLAPRAQHRPGELSGGEQQRVAIARAVVMKPEILLADEPTGNLDQKTGALVLDTLLGLRREENMGIVLVSHDLSLRAKMDKRFALTEGRLIRET